MHKFGDSLYSMDKDGNEYYIPLCRNTQAKSNGEFMHCALSELYEFITHKKAARKLTKAEKEKYTHHLPDYDDSFPYFNLENNVVIFHDEETLAQDLVKNAVISNDYTLDDLVYELAHELPMSNDSIKGYTESAMIKRAKRVQKKVYKIADIYLR